MEFIIAYYSIMFKVGIVIAIIAFMFAIACFIIGHILEKKGK